MFPNTRRRFTRGRHVCALLWILLCSACVETIQSPPTDAQLQSIKSLASLGEPCGVLFRVMTFEENAELEANYQLPMQSDTVDICETWIGNDYRWAVHTVGTSERAAGVYDMARDAAYASGVLYVAEQGTVLSSQQVGSNLFDTFNADASQVQASYDDPYYGIVAAESCPLGTCAMLRVGEQPGSAGAPPARDTLFKRHGVTRRGVRALVEGMHDMGRSPDGLRRFTKQVALGERTVLVHPVSQLLMGEEFRDNEVEMSARNEWVPANFGHVRSRTVVEIRRRGGNRVLLQRTTLVISNVRYAGQ